MGPNGVDDAWADSLEAWRRGVGRLTGNLVEVLEVSADRAEAAVACLTRLGRGGH